MFLRNKKQLPEMVRHTRNNGSQSSPSNPSMVDATLEATSQQNPQVAPTVGTSHTEALGATMPTHVSSTIPVASSTVVAAAQSQVGFGSQSYPNTWFFFYRNQPYGVPSSFMVGLHTNPSSFSKSLNAIHSPCFHPGVGFPGSNPQQTLTNASIMALRQQMDDTNHEMVNMLTQQIGTVFNPLIQQTHNSYQTLIDQMGRIVDFFGAPPTQNRPMPHNQNLRPVQILVERLNNGAPVAQIQQPVVELQPQGKPERAPILVQRNQDADQVVRKIQQNNFDGRNNIANIVETFLVQSGFNMGLHRPNFISTLSDYVLAEELP